MNRKAFTLVELLTVIGIIAVLIGILVPGLNRARQTAQSIKCAAQLKQIYAGVQMYTNAHRGALSKSKLGTRWLTTTGTIQLIEPQGTRAYWGVAYAPYVLPMATLRQTGSGSAEIIRGACGVWHCPSSTFSDPSSGTKPEDPVSYGINGMITGTIPPLYRRMSTFKNTSQVIFAHDAMLSQLSSNEFDTLSSFDGPMNLTNYRPGGAVYPFTTAGVREFYRHIRNSNVLWLDGHVSPIGMSDGTDVPKRWYNPNAVN